MNRIQPKTIRSIIQNDPRAGMAPMEIVMVLPILCALLTLIMYVCLFSINRTEVVIEARQSAWKDRHNVRSAKQLRTPSGFVIGRVVRRDGRPPEGGVIESSKSRPIVSVANTLGLNKFNVSSKHTLLAGTWDYRLNKFDRVRQLGISNKALDVGAASPFGLLGILSFGGVGSGFSGALSRATDIVGPISAQFGRFQLAPLRLDIARLKGQRALEEDPDKRRALSRQIDRKQRELDRRKALIDQFNAGF